MAAFPSSYIPTVASQVTRAADVASMTGANFSSWYRQDEGSFVVGAVTSSLSSSLATGFFEVSDGTTGNRITVRASVPSANNAAVIFNGGVNQAALSSTITVTGAQQTISLAYRANDFSYSDKGGAAVVDTGGTVPTVTSIAIGSSLGSAPINGHIRSLSYYPKRLTNAELQALSTQ